MRLSVPRTPWSRAAVLAGLLLASCGGGGGGGGGTGGGVGGGGSCVAGTGPLVTITGTVLYERKALTAGGLSAGLVARPARWVDVELIESGTGTCYGATSADATGAYVLVGNPPQGTTVSVVAYSRTDYDPLRNVTAHSALPPSSNVHTNADCFSQASTPFSAASATVNLTVPYNPGDPNYRPSIGFGLLDILLGCSEAIRTSVSETPPLCHAYTQLGNGGATGTYYDSFAHALSVLAGMAGDLDGTDTDYFDDGVVAHEYGHFVEFNMAASRNRGGPHSGQNLEPPFAWSEGAATGWGCLLRKDPMYIDTVGTSGGTSISVSVENWTPQTVRGIGGEETVTELVWDLVDGTAGYPSTDGDGCAIAFAPLYAQFLSYDPSQVVPYIGTLLDRAVNPVGASPATIAALMVAPENQQISYPLTGNDVWPVPLAVPGTANGSCDSLQGSNKSQCRGLTSSVWYRFSVASAVARTFTLTIGTTAGNGDNLNLYLETFAGVPLGQSTNAGAATETIGPITLQPGNYIVRVEADCSGQGNQATFTLTAN